MLSDPVAEAFGLIHRHPLGENFFRGKHLKSFESHVLLCISQFQAFCKRQHPSPRHTPGELFEAVKSPAPGQNFSAKPWPRDKNTFPREYFRRVPFLLIGVEILGFFRNQTLKRIGRLSNYSLVIPSSFSLCTILKVLKFPPALKQIS